MLNIWTPLIFISIFLLLTFTFIATLLSDQSGFLWIVPLIMIFVLFTISYYRVRNGYGSNQILKLDNSTLLVINKWFIFKRTENYRLTSLDLEVVEPWNMFTGTSTKLKLKLARLIINEDKTLDHFYKLAELKALIEEFKTGANIL